MLNMPLHKKVVSVTKYIDTINVDEQAKRDLFIQSIACHISCKLDIPSQAVTAPKIYFIETHQAFVNQCVGEINEIKMFPIDAVTTLVYDLWKKRYDCCHIPQVTLKALLDTPSDSTVLNHCILTLNR